MDHLLLFLSSSFYVIYVSSEFILELLTLQPLSSFLYILHLELPLSHDRKPSGVSFYV